MSKHMRSLCAFLTLPAAAVSVVALLTPMPAVARTKNIPSVTTVAASSVSASAATLNGTVNPSGSSTRYYFQYGKSTSYGSSAPAVSLSSGTPAMGVTAALSGLPSATTYHFRLVAANATGISHGSDMTFATRTTTSGGGGGGSSSTYDAAVLADHPVALWDMHAGSSETDQTRNGHTGSYVNGAPKAATMPNGDSAADFSGSSQYMEVPSSSVFSIPTTKALTWEAWIRPDVLQWANDFVNWMGKCSNYSPTCEWEARMYASVNSEGRCNRLSAYAFNLTAGYGSGAFWQPFCNVIKAGQWLHVVGEYQTRTTPSGCRSSYPGTINIWVNGVEWNASAHNPTGCMSEYSIAPKAASSTLRVGAVALDSFFPGAIGKVAIYDSLLGQSQINAHFAAMTGAQPSPVPTQ
jgi:hypothetical protein